MKQKHLLFFLLAFGTFSLPIHSQQYTIEELKQGFYDQYVEKTIDSSAYRVDSLNMANLHHYYESHDRIILCPSDSLHQAGKLRLPLSRFVWITEVIGEKDRLYWQDALEVEDSVEYQKLRTQLVKKYGHIFLDDGTELIPANWFTGDLKLLTNAFVYGGEVVAYWLRKTHVVEGSIQFHEEGNPFYYNRYRGAPLLEREASSIEKTRLDGKMEIRVDGHTSREERALKTAKGLALFARDINRCIDNRLLFSMQTRKEYSVMLYLDENTLKAHLHPLLPQELTDEDRLQFSLLSTAVEQQPAGTFKGYDSGRGFFPAIYLKANCSRGRWSFEDYRFEDVYEAMKKPKH